MDLRVYTKSTNDVCFRRNNRMIRNSTASQYPFSLLRVYVWKTYGTGHNVELKRPSLIDRK